MKIFKIFNRGRVLKRIKNRLQKQQNGEGPEKIVKDIAKDWLTGYAIYYGLWMLLIIAFLCVLSFTSWLGGPYVVAQIILFLFVGSILLLAGSLLWLWRKAKKEVDNLKKRHERRKARDAKTTDSDIRNAEVISSKDDE